MVDPDSLRDRISSVLATLRLAETPDKAQALAQLRDGLAASPSVAEELFPQLEELARTGDHGVGDMLCEIFTAGVHRSSSSQAATLTLSLQLAKSFLTQQTVISRALSLISAVLSTAFENSQLRFTESSFWEAFHSATDAALSFVDGGPMHARVRAVKLAQAVLLLLTSSSSTKLARSPAQIAQQVQKHLKQLLGVLREAKSGAQNSVLTLAALQVAQQVVVLRHGQAGRLLPSILALASADFPEVSRGSIHKCLRAGLLVIYSSEVPSLRAWKPKVGDALTSLGVRLEASPAPDQHQPAQLPEHTSEIGPHQQQEVSSQVGTPPASHQIMQPEYGAGQSQMQHLQPPSLQSQSGFAMPQPAQENFAVGNETSDADIRQVIAIVAALLAENDETTCLAFVNGLPAAVLADVVLTSMANLPRREDILSVEPQDLDQRSGNALLAGLIQATELPEGGPAAQSSFKLPASTTAVSQGLHSDRQSLQAISQAPQSQSPGPPLDPRLHRMPSPQKPAASVKDPGSAAGPSTTSQGASAAQQAGAQGSKPARPKLSPPAIKLQPLQLSREQMAAGAQDALKRVMAASVGPCMQLRGSILAHAAPYLQEEAWSQAFADELISRKNSDGYELALRYLCAVFSATLPPPAMLPEVAERTESGKSASVSQAKDVQPSSAYTSCLKILLYACKDRLPAKDRTAAQLLVDAPALPDSLLQDFLQSLLGMGEEHATLALITARDVVLMRPRNRTQALSCMLEMAVAPDAEIRAKAVRLVANKLFSNIVLTAHIQNFASAELKMLSGQPPQHKRPRDASINGRDLETAKRPREELEANGELDREGSTAEQKSGVNGVHTSKEPAEKVDTTKASGASAAEADATPANAESSARTAGKRKAEPLDLDRATKRPNVAEPVQPSASASESAPAPVANGSVEGPAAEAADEETAEQAARHCELYCALCTKSHALLRDLFTVFGTARSPGRAAILKNADGLARVLGPSAQALLAIIKDVPPGADSLLLKMLYFLTESQRPPEVLVEACRKNYAQTRDPSILPPALAGMPKEEIIELLPRLLEPVSLFSVALARIILQGPSGEGSMTPTEVLLALHSIDPAKAGVRLKQIIGALDYCLTQREVFGKAPLASALQQLNQRPALPPLFMRFLMQSQAAVPDLKSFMIEQLAALVGRQIWTNKTLFTGWNLAVRKNAPESFPAFLQLPMRVLTETLQTAPEDFQHQLKEYASSPACPANQRNPILRLLESLGK